MTPTLTIVLPTLNEEGNIALLIAELQKSIPAVRIIVVDDSSTDNTAGIVQEIAGKDAAVTLIRRTGAPCLTASIMAGVRRAESDYVAWMDADFSHPPEVMAQLFAAARLHGCSIATRYAVQDSKSEGMQNDSLLNSMLSAVLNFLIRNVLKLNVTDYTSGFIVCEREILADHDFVGDYGEYFIEILYFISRNGVTIHEVSYNSPPRHAGESKTGTTVFKLVRRGIKYLILTLRLSLPKALFGKLSLQR